MIEEEVQQELASSAFFDQNAWTRKGDPMNRDCFLRIAPLMAVVVCLWAMSGCQFDSSGYEEQAQTQAAPEPADENELVIRTDSELPDTFPHAIYEFRLVAHRGVTPLHWRLETGALPAGIKLEDDGLLHGAAERQGEFRFTVSVTDSGKPQQAVQKQFVIRVRAALNINWKTPAHVNGNRIEGSVEVSNTTPDDIDLTFIVLAVASNGRATAIGYQRFLLQKGTTGKELPFGETLPRGGYVVHVDAVGEVARMNLIYRERLQTSGPLQVMVGP